MPIVIVDVDKCLEAEREKIETMLARYKSNPNSKQATNIRQRIRNNKQTESNFCNDIIQELEQIQVRERKFSIRSKKKVSQKQRKTGTIDEQQLDENYQNVSPIERQKGSRGIRHIYKIIQDTLEKGGNNDGR